MLVGQRCGVPQWREGARLKAKPPRLHSRAFGSRGVPQPLSGLAQRMRRQAFARRRGFDAECVAGGGAVHQ